MAQVAGRIVLALAVILGCARAFHFVPLDALHQLPQLGHQAQAMISTLPDAAPASLGASSVMLADVATAAIDKVAEAAATAAPGPWDTFRQFVESSIVNLHDVLQNRLGVQQAYGPAIVLFTVGVKLLLLPLNYKQLESSQKVTALNPLQEEIKQRYAHDKPRQQQMLAALFAETEVNPLAGCLPSLVQIPVFIALYRSLLRLAARDQLDEPFLWIPSLNGPQFGYNPGHTLDWLTDKWDGNIPPLGWHDTIAYLVLPLVLFVTQKVSLKLLSPPTNGDPQMERTNRIINFLPYMITWFAANAPAGLGLYWLTNNIITTTTSVSIKEYFKRNPVQFENVDLDTLANAAQSMMGGLKYDDYLSQRSKFLDEALVHPLPPRPRRRVEGAGKTDAVRVDVGAAASQ